MPEKLQFRDRREMQLFAERVLQYRFPDKQFQSFGYHQPDIEHNRKVYTATDNTLYYFLPSVNPESVETAIADIEQLLKEHPFLDLDGSTRAIQSVVLVGEFESADRPALNETEIEAIEQKITDYQGDLEIGLSYIDEDLYWDIRRDRIETEPYNGNRTPVTEVLSALKSAPPVAPVSDRPRYASNPIELVSPTTVADVTVVESADHLEISNLEINEEFVDQDQPERPTRDSGRELGWLEGMSSLALLAGIALLGLLTAGLFLWRWLINPDSAPSTAQNPSAVGSKSPTNGTSTGTSTGGKLPVPQPPPSNRDRAQKLNPPPKTTPANTPPANTAPPATNPPAAQPNPPANLLLVQPPSGNYNAVNLREGPGMGYRSIGAIRQGNYVIDAGQQQGNWRKVNYYNKTGWVYQSFIR